MNVDIASLSSAEYARIRAAIDAKLKPPGALGRLENLAFSLVRILGPHQTGLVSPTMLLFAGDHGVAAEGVSVVDAEVTRLMVERFLKGDASINVFCRQSQMALRVIDCGMLSAPAPHPLLTSHRLGSGTAPFHLASAMSKTTVLDGMENGRAVVQSLKKSGSNLIALGEMGIGNTTSASALMAALTGLPLEQCIGSGSGITPTAMARKREIIQLALQRHARTCHNITGTLAALGGFEIVTMTGAILAAAELGMAVLVDGFIATVAALCACRFDPGARAYLIFAQCGSERGHRPLLAHMDAEALLDLGLRMGEGAGAALALPLLRSALAFYHEMATFEDAGLHLPR